MKIAAFDVHYLKDGGASAAALLFHDYRDDEPAVAYTRFIAGAAGYIPGEFYKRELPCILTLLEQFNEAPDEMVVDGYVMLGNRPGLGQHLFEFFDGKIPVIGVAKSKFEDSRPLKNDQFRSRSRKTKILTTGIHGVFRGLKFESDVAIGRKGSFCKGPDSSGAMVFRGVSKRPLYITAAGMDLGKASESIRTMHGAHRIPTLLKRVDLMARERA